MKIFLVAFITSSLSTNALTTWPSFFIFFDALNMLPPSSLLISSLSLSSSFRSASSSSIYLMRSLAYSLSKYLHNVIDSLNGPLILFPHCFYVDRAHYFESQVARKDRQSLEHRF
jgi:hypothetical protein